MAIETVKAKVDLNAERSAIFVQKACRHACDIKVSVGDQSVNAKSMLGVINIGIMSGVNVTIAADGRDEIQAVSELTGLLCQ